MRVSPDDPQLVIYDNGHAQRMRAPIVALFDVDGVTYARTRRADRTRDTIEPLSPDLKRWKAYLKAETDVVVEGRTLRAARFSRTFDGDVATAVELDDGGFAVLVSFGTVPIMGSFPLLRTRSAVVALGPDGGDRWTQEYDAYLLWPLDHRAIPDALRIAIEGFGALLHPYDGRLLVRWPEK